MMIDSNILTHSFQHTVGGPFVFTGVGVHSGVVANCVVRPAPADTGVVFFRTDMPQQGGLRASAKKVQQTMLCTLLTDGLIKISTVEHLMSSFWGMGVDNAYVEIDQEEMPIMDGSAAPFCDMIKSVGVSKQNAKRSYLKIITEYEYIEGDKYVRFMPYVGGEMRYEVDFSNVGVGPQQAIFNVSSNNYEVDLARARTFGFAHEIAKLRSMGLARGGSLENAVGIAEDGSILNPEGLRYSNELALHKLLDLAGDMFLHNHRIIGRIEVYKASHSMHNAALNALLNSSSAFEMICM